MMSTCPTSNDSSTDMSGIYALVLPTCIVPHNVRAATNLHPIWSSKPHDFQSQVSQQRGVSLVEQEERSDRNAADLTNPNSASWRGVVSPATQIDVQLPQSLHRPGQMFPSSNAFILIIASPKTIVNHSPQQFSPISFTRGRPLFQPIAS